MLDIKEYLKQTKTVLVTQEAFDELVKKASAQPEQRWIPVSERLPEKESQEQRRGFYLTTNAYGSVSVTKYEFDGDFGFIGWGTHRPVDIRIIAWMPLPEPYEGSVKE